MNKHLMSYEELEAAKIAREAELKERDQELRILREEYDRLLVQCVMNGIDPN